MLRDLPLTSCYLDDVIIAGETLEDCMVNVERVLEKLNQCNVKVNIKKCQWFCPVVHYLGHELCAEGIKPIKDKVEAVQNATRPENITQLRSFLGLLNYYGKFLPMLSSVLEPLYEVERNSAAFEWSRNCESAFCEGKQMLLKSGTLVHYDLSKPRIVSSDASPYGVGAVLSHLVNNVERPVMFVSSTLSKSEQNYSQLHKEALAIIFAIKKFHTYIYGRKFLLHTDH